MNRVLPVIDDEPLVTYGKEAEMNVEVWVELLVVILRIFAAGMAG